MDTKNVYVRWSFFILLGGLFASLLGSCGFEVCINTSEDLCSLIPDSPLTELTSEGRTVVFEKEGTIIVYHGNGCAESNKAEQEDVIRVEQSLDIPSYATNATVFLNGWHLHYYHKDHPVAGLATLIRNIRLEGKTLKWEAHGALSDKNFDDAYSWCYYYTVVAWNPSNINLMVDHKDGCDARDPRKTNFFRADNVGATTALSSFPTFLQNPDFAASKTVAILPRGFMFIWGKGNLAICDLAEHKLLQIGYNMDHSEVFIEKDKKYRKGMETVANSESRVGLEYVSWETSAIFKDNKARRVYTFGEIVSGLFGNDVGIIQPPFSIRPVEDMSNCVSAGISGMKTEEFVIENVPYEHAIPVLTGWELNYDCDDENVKDIGIWIDEMHYDKDPNVQTGTLTYKLSSILKDKDFAPGTVRRHKVTVLGLKAVAGGIPSGRSPDLLPFSPTGTDPSAFCRFEEGGKLLRVSVKNQGNEHAAASRTTVLFHDIPVTMDTPPVPAGGSVDLLFKVPSNCFRPDCSFKITVDSGNQVNELNSEGNNSANGFCLG